MPGKCNKASGKGRISVRKFVMIYNFNEAEEISSWNSCLENTFLLQDSSQVVHEIIMFLKELLSLLLRYFNEVSFYPIIAYAIQ